MAAAKDFTGQTFGDFAVIERVRTRTDAKHRAAYWQVRSSLGSERVVRTDKLPLLRQAKQPRRPNYSTTRGLCRVPEYHVWYQMNRRCDTPTNIAFKYYGGRGITVCARWQSFEDFHADMGSRPSPKHTIDRIDNDGNYEPGNCRWATRSEQNLNKRKRA